MTSKDPFTDKRIIETEGGLQDWKPAESLVPVLEVTNKQGTHGFSLLFPNLSHVSSRYSRGVRDCEKIDHHDIDDWYAWRPCHRP